MLTLSTTILRTDADGDTIECDVAVHFSATCVNPGYRATQTDPGEGPEYECLFEGAEFDGGGPDDELTPDELERMRTWFATRGDAASEAANDNDIGWRGLEA